MTANLKTLQVGAFLVSPRDIQEPFPNSKSFLHPPPPTVPQLLPSDPLPNPAQWMDTIARQTLIGPYYAEFMAGHLLVVGCQRLLHANMLRC